MFDACLGHCGDLWMFFASTQLLVLIVGLHVGLSSFTSSRPPVHLEAPWRAHEVVSDVCLGLFGNLWKFLENMVSRFWHAD